MQRSIYMPSDLNKQIEESKIHPSIKFSTQVQILCSFGLKYLQECQHKKEFKNS